MPYAPYILALGGLLLIVVSNTIYYRRTEDEDVWQRFWLGRGQLSTLEFILNRLGFLAAIASLFWLFLVRIDI
jgi:hypothetical protein